MRRLSFVVVCVLLFGCGGSPEESPAPGPDKVNVGVIAILDVAPIYLGKEKGFFANRDIDLTLTPAQGGAAIVPAVVSGQYQFGFSNVVSLLLAQSQRLPLKVVSNGNNSTGEDGKDFGSVLVRADSPIRTAADLAGRNIAVNTLRNIVDTTVRASVREAGADASSLRFTELPFPDMPAALQGGKVDAAFMVEPFQSAARAQGARSVASSYVDAAPNLTVAVYFTSTALIDSDPDLVRRFSEAMRESLAYADANPDEARRVIGTYTKITPEVIAQVTLPKWPPEVNRASVQTLADLALQDGLLESPADVNALLP
ncbi:ABC transporter substrate-binding protein [Phytohabitans sp. LJ34]|uniref:ABC transporter substrate-binding protein n=1 Tax=Phytohabitans sp. LJ34 TaxID=3452217 RepID=UPI003F88B107